MNDLSDEVDKLSVYALNALAAAATSIAREAATSSGSKSGLAPKLRKATSNAIELCIEFANGKTPKKQRVTECKSNLIKIRDEAKNSYYRGEFADEKLLPIADSALKAIQVLNDSINCKSGSFKNPRVFRNVVSSTLDLINICHQRVLSYIETARNSVEKEMQRLVISLQEKSPNQSNGGGATLAFGSLSDVGFNWQCDANAYSKAVAPAPPKRRRAKSRNHSQKAPNRATVSGTRKSSQGHLKPSSSTSTSPSLASSHVSRSAERIEFSDESIYAAAMPGATMAAAILSSTCMVFFALLFGKLELWHAIVSAVVFFGTLFATYKEIVKAISS